MVYGFVFGRFCERYDKLKKLILDTKMYFSSSLVKESSKAMSYWHRQNIREENWIEFYLTIIISRTFSSKCITQIKKCQQQSFTRPAHWHASTRTGFMFPLLSIYIITDECPKFFLLSFRFICVFYSFSWIFIYHSMKVRLEMKKYFTKKRAFCSPILSASPESYQISVPLKILSSWKGSTKSQSLCNKWSSGSLD